jgi:hypothetical protein
MSAESGALRSIHNSISAARFDRFYTYTDTANMMAKADRLLLGDGNHGSWFFVLRGHLPDRPWFIEKIPSLS